MVPLCLWSTGWQGENSWLSSVSPSSSLYPFPLFAPAYLLPFFLCLLFPGNVTCFHSFNCYFYTKNFWSIWPGFLLYWFACLRFLLRCIKFNIQASSVQMDILQMSSSAQDCFSPSALFNGKWLAPPTRPFMPETWKLACFALFLDLLNLSLLAPPKDLWHPSISFLSHCHHSNLSQHHLSPVLQ